MLVKRKKTNPKKLSLDRLSPVGVEAVERLTEKIRATARQLQSLHDDCQVARRTLPDTDDFIVATTLNQISVISSMLAEIRVELTNRVQQARVKG